MRTVVVLTLVVLCLFGMAGCGIEGLHNANPHTMVRVDPFNKVVEFYDNKDNDLRVTGFEAATANGGSAKVEELTISNKSSPVREANYIQMQGMALQAQVNWNGASQALTALAGVIREVGAFLPQAIAARALDDLRAITLGPNGLSLSPGDAATFQAITGYLQAAALRPAPATQPTQ